MEFWLTYNNRKEKLQLPVPPKEFTIQEGNNINIININSFGEFALIGKSKLASIEIASFFPSKVYSFCQYSNFPMPYDCVALIKRWMNSGKPIRLTITDTNINISAVIENFSYSEKGGTRDVYFSLSLKEYRYQSEEKIAVTTEKTTTRAVEDIQAKTYKVKSGDTLYTIAKKVYGDGSKYITLISKNKIKDPNLIQVGQELIV